ncbi:MAG: DUF4419 domain-containing protein [Propionibacteriaceae bacterium]|nr:DUF4419 domain-containing protein [Propionibacteriaceae bacterium]
MGNEISNNNNINSIQSVNCLPDKKRDANISFEYDTSIILQNNIRYDNPLNWRIVSKILEASKHSSDRKYEIRIHENPFYESALLAFNYHFKYVISPDVFWVQILQGIALHIYLNKSQFEGRFFDNHKELIVQNTNQVTNSETLDTFINGIMNSMYTHTKARELIEILNKPFSTTSVIGKLIFSLGIMDIMKNYVTYVNQTLCGIPGFEILGTEQDWNDFEKRLIVIGTELHLQWWINFLLPIIKNIQNTVKLLNLKQELPIEIIEFWNDFVQLNHQSGKKEVTGWINFFSPYHTDNIKQSQLDSIHTNSNIIVENRCFTDKGEKYSHIYRYSLIPIDIYRELYKIKADKLKHYRRSETKNNENNTNNQYFGVNLEVMTVTQGKGKIEYIEESLFSRTTHNLYYGIFGIAINSEDDTIMPILGIHLK